MPSLDLETEWGWEGGIRNKLPLDRGSNKVFVATFHELQILTKKYLLKNLVLKLIVHYIFFLVEKFQLVKLHRPRGEG